MRVRVGVGLLPNRRQASSDGLGTRLYVTM
jgi:hypothetical protein